LFWFIFFMLRDYLFGLVLAVSGVYFGGCTTFNKVPEVSNSYFFSSKSQGYVNTPERKDNFKDRNGRKNLGDGLVESLGPVVLDALF
jgi:hypothetical protein